MTRDPVGRRGAGKAIHPGRMDPGTLLAFILLGGLAVRVFIAAAYLPLSGLANDIGAFTAWGQRMAAVGPGNFYEPGYFADYPPGYLYVLWLLGIIGSALTPLVGQDATGGLVKIPGIASDIGVAWLLFVLARRWGRELIDRTSFSVTPEQLGLVAATIYLFNPGVVIGSAVWGQIDSFGTLLLLAVIYALGRGWTEAAALGAVVAMLVKFQFAFLVPVVAVVGLKRHLFGRSADPRHAAGADRLRVLTSLATGVASVTLLILPLGMVIYAPLAGGDPRGLFGLLPQADPMSLVGKLTEAVNTYTGLSVNAFNLWRNPWSGLGDTLHWGDDTTVAFTLGGASLTWQHVGTLAFAVVAVMALVAVARRDDMRGVLLASLVLAIAFFALPTRVHERYLFPALAIAAPLVLSGRAWPWIYGALSLSFFANIYWVYTEDWSFAYPPVINPGMNGEPMPQDRLLEATLFTDWGIWLLGGLVTLTLAVVLIRTLRTAFAARTDEPPMPEPEAVPTAAHGLASQMPATGPAARPPGRLARWLAPDPADAYLREPGRRLDRRDLAVVLVLVAFALAFRIWRLDVPRGYHFDEVYHARSATEFLADWENGWTRDVYEWTHPMLAKYLIAAGIVATDPNRVIATRRIDAPAAVLAVAPRRESVGQHRSIGFRVEGGTRIVAFDVGSGDEVARWVADGQVAALAYDPVAVRLLVGRTDSGTVASYELTGLLASPDGRAPPEGPPIESGLASVVEIRIGPERSDPVLLRGMAGVAVVDRDGGEVRSTTEGAYGGVGWVRGVEEEDPDLLAVSDPAAGSISLLDPAGFGSSTDADAGDGSAGDTDGDDDRTVRIDGARLVGPFLSRGGGKDQELVALTGPLEATDEHPATDGGLAVLDADGSGCSKAPCLRGLAPLPGAGVLIADQRIANLVYVAGTAADGRATVWTVEPHFESRGSGSIGMGAFDATALPAGALALAFDITGTSQADDAGRLLVSTADGQIVTIDAGSNSFAWRISGVAFGSVLVGLIYLLAATMFGRRRIGVLAAAFVAVDGMSFVMSRISMNDIFVTTFIVAAYLAFWQVWSGRWSRSAWWVLPLVGVLIGLASATKWVGFYALAGLVVLSLARSALGRLVLVILVAMALVVGANGAPWPFGLTLAALLVLALVISWARPIRIDGREALGAMTASAMVLAGLGLAFVLAFDQVDGARTPNSAVEYVFGLLARGAQVGWPAWVMVGVAAVLVLWRALASLRDPRSDARWFEPGQMGGFAWPWIGACLVIIPLVIYGLSYLPYLALGHQWALPGGPGYGWSLDELHAQMFGYHFNLKAGHDSASPWWSWPLMLKPTWFHSAGPFDGDRLAVIYNGGNPILFWAGMPALAACALLAWKRRSMALVLIVAAFAFQYVPWIRIERATFAYHYLTAVVFAMVAVAYCVDELLRRPGWRDLAIGYLVMVVVVGLLIFPLGSALPMPDWYINAARALPPWNYNFKFPGPPQGDRAELLAFGTVRMIAGVAVAVAAGAFAMHGRTWWKRRRGAAAEAPHEDPLAPRDGG